MRVKGQKPQEEQKAKGSVGASQVLQQQHGAATGQKRQHLPVARYLCHEGQGHILTWAPEEPTVLLAATVTRQAAQSCLQVDVSTGQGHVSTVGGCTAPVRARRPPGRGEARAGICQPCPPQQPPEAGA